jgi:hypothetical protein
MDRIQKLLILLAAGIAVAVPGYVVIARFAAAPADPITTATIAAAPDLCLTADAVTYRVAPGAAAADYRVRIDAAHPDLHIQLVDGVESADFALVDDGGSAGSCASAGLIRTVQIVDEPGPADVTVSLSRKETPAALKLFVRSARFGEQDAAALFVAMRHYQGNTLLAGIGGL